MSEQLAAKPEQTKPSSELNETLALPTALEAEPLRPGEADPVKALNEARNRVAENTREDQPNPIEKLEADEKASAAMVPRQIRQELKQITLRREMHRIRSKLPLPERTLSKVIHQPAIRALSEGAGKTLSRPSGLLGGGLVAFLGTSGYLYLARHIGFTYNYLVFLILLLAGFGLGLLIELAVYLALSSHRRTD